MADSDFEEKYSPFNEDVQFSRKKENYVQQQPVLFAIMVHKYIQGPMLSFTVSGWKRGM